MHFSLAENDAASCFVYCAEENAEDGASTSANSRAAVQASAAHEAVVKITIELKQLELLAAEIEESANRLSADAVTAADVAQGNLDAAQRDDQVNARLFSDLSHALCAVLHLT